MPENTPQNEQEFLSPVEQFEQELHLREQYDSQLRILAQAGILQLLPEMGKNPQETSRPIGIIDTHGRECPIPTYEEIRARFTPEKIALLKEKADQGFKKLLLVPIGMPLGGRKQDENGRYEYHGLIGKFTDLVRKFKKADKLKATDGSNLELNDDEPLWTWDQIEHSDENGSLRYFNDSFDSDSGYTKDQVILVLGEKSQ